MPWTSTSWSRRRLPSRSSSATCTATTATPSSRYVKPASSSRRSPSVHKHHTPAVSNTAYCCVVRACIFQVGVPCSSLFKTVAVRCGHCANLLSVNLRGLLLPAANQLPFGQALLSPTSPHGLLVRIVIGDNLLLYTLSISLYYHLQIFAACLISMLD
jgi:hypothetical protein